MSADGDATSGRTWVAFGPVGAVGSIHEVDGGFNYKLLSDPDYRAVLPTLDAAKGALHAALKPGSEWPEFKEH
jgi:hypothetical protein